MQIPNVLCEIPTFGNPMLERYVSSIYPKLSPGLLLASWTKCGTSDVKLEIQRSGTALTSKGFKTRKLKFIFIPNLYQFNPIHTMLLPTSFSRKTSSPRRENPDTFAFDRFIPPTLLYNTLLHGSLQHVSPKLLYNTIQPFSTPPPTPFYDTLLQQFSTTPFENNLHNALSNQHCHAPLEPFPLTLLYSTLLQHLSTVDILP